MKCSYHPTVESQSFCTTCNKPLCPECSHQIKSKTYCQDCLIRGAEWAAAVKDLRVPADSPKRAALCSIIPGMGAVYNGEYLKAITFFAVFASLVILGDDVHGVFGFGAFTFLIFTMFDSYRTAEIRTRIQIEPGRQAIQPARDKSVIGWGMFLIALGILFLIQNMIPYRFLHHLWPLVFILLGGYLVWRAVKDRDDVEIKTSNVFSERKEF
jgi:LiaI-LiaF-like transmembrane region